MRRAQAGDAEAFGALVALHRTSALRVATVVLGQADDADDVVQVATERAMGAVAGFDIDRPFRPWFLQIVANGARNHRRARWRRRTAELRVAAQPASIDDPASAAVVESQRLAVMAALNRLAAPDRLVIALRHFDQLSEREMAVVLACATGTVKSRLARATQRLRAELAKARFDDE